MLAAGENGGWLMSVDMASLTETRVLNIYDGTLTSLHISGKAFNKPGWVAVSTYNCRDSGGWACDKVSYFVFFSCCLNIAVLMSMHICSR